MAASENGRFEHQFRILLVVVALDLVVSLLLWGIETVRGVGYRCRGL